MVIYEHPGTKDTGVKGVGGEGGGSGERTEAVLGGRGTRESTVRGSDPGGGWWGLAGLAAIRSIINLCINILSAGAIDHPAMTSPQATHCGTHSLTNRKLL